MSILDGLFYQTSTIVFASVLLVRFDGIGNWTSESVLLLAAIRMAAHALCSLTSGQLLFIGDLLTEGHIDTYLSRPGTVKNHIMYSRFNINAFGDLLVGGTMLAFAIHLFDHPWTLERSLLLVTGVIGGALVEVAVMTMLAGASLLQPWAIAWQSRFQDILATVGNYPLNILPLLGTTILTFVIPVAFVAYLPAAMVTDQVAATGLPSWLVYGSPLVGGGLYCISQAVWKFCLTRYQGSNT